MATQETLPRVEEEWKVQEAEQVPPTHRLPRFKPEEPLVTVIIPTHNYGHLIGETMNSVLNQTYRNLEIIVVDDGSTDKTEEIVRTYPNVKYIFQAHRGNHTPARAANTGLNISSGEYIICLGADDKIVTTYVERCLEIITHNPKVGIVFTGTQEFGAAKQCTTPAKTQ